MNLNRNDLIGVLLAGGLSRRMGGGDKNLLYLGDKAILQHTIDRMKPQVSQLILNANEPTERFECFGLPIIADVIEGNLGPLVGVLSGMEWCLKNSPDSKWLVTLPTDAPFLPLNMVSNLFSRILEDGSDIACASSNGRTHPPFAVWRVSLVDELRHALVSEGIRKIDKWTERYPVSQVEFEEQEVDPFFNINRPGDLTNAQQILKIIEEEL